MGLLDQIIDNHTSARVVSEDHNLKNIAVSNGDVDSAIRALSGNRGWDAAEYGITKEQAEAMFQAANTPEARQRVMVELQQRAIQRAGLDTSTGRVAVMFAVEPGWHKLGTVVDKRFRSRDAKGMPELNFKMAKEAMAYRDKNGNWKEDEEVFSIKRMDTGAKLGTVGNKFKIIQNEQSWEFLDEVVGEFGAEFESVGSIYGGKQMWAQIHMPQQAFAIGSHTHVDPYVTFFKKNDGSGCDICFPTGVRGECANTTRLALAGRKGKGIAIRHTGNIKAKIADARKALGLTIEGFEKFREGAEVLSKTPLVNGIEYYANDVLDAALDITAAQTLLGADALAAALQVTKAQQELERKSFQRQINRRENILEDILKKYESRTNDGTRGTAWGGFNAVSESADHGKLGGHYKGDEQKRLSRQFLNVVQGEADEVKQVAFEKAMVLAV